MNQIEITKERIINGNINSFFDCLTDILMKYSNNSLDKCLDFDKYFSKYMICRYLSMSVRFINIAEYLNSIQYNLTNSQFYHLTYSLVPKQTNSFIKYLKAKSKDKNKENKIIENNSEVKSILFDI